MENPEPVVIPEGEKEVSAVTTSIPSEKPKKGEERGPYIGIKLHYKKLVEEVLKGTPKNRAYAKAFGHAKVKPKYTDACSAVLKRPEVKAYYERRKVEIEEVVDVRAEEIIAKFWEIAQDDNAADSARVNALVWLGKYKGIFKQNGEGLGQPITLNIVNYQDMPKLRSQKWGELSGERYHTLPVQAEDVSGTGVGSVYTGNKMVSPRQPQAERER